jgi:hypothetical protein
MNRLVLFFVPVLLALPFFGQVGVTIVLNGSDCQRHLVEVKALNDLDPRIPLKIAFPERDYPIHKALLKRFGLRERPGITCIASDSLAMNSPNGTSYCRVEDGSQLLVTRGIEEVRACVEAANIIRSVGTIGVPVVLQDSTALSTDVLVECDDGVIYAVDRRLDLLKIIRTQTTPTGGQCRLIQIDSMALAFFSDRATKAQEMKAHWGTPAKRVDPAIAVVNIGSQHDSLLVIASYSLDLDPTDTILDDYGGLFITIGPGGDGRVRSITALEESFDGNHRIVAWSGASVDDNEDYYFNLRADSCTGEGFYFGKFHREKRALVFKGFIEPRLPTVPVETLRNCYDFRDVAMRDRLAIIHEYPLIMQLGESKTHDLGAQFSANGMDYKASQKNTGMYLMDFRDLSADLVSCMFRYETGYKIVIIDLSNDSVIYRADLQRESQGANHYAFMGTSIINVCSDGRKLYRH